MFQKNVPVRLRSPAPRRKKLGSFCFQPEGLAESSISLKLLSPFPTKAKDRFCGGPHSDPLYRGVEQLVARRAHNPEVAGSNPVPATRKKVPNSLRVGCFSLPFTSRMFNSFEPQKADFPAHLSTIYQQVPLEPPPNTPKWGIGGFFFVVLIYIYYKIHFI